MSLTPLQSAQILRRTINSLIEDQELADQIYRYFLYELVVRGSVAVQMGTPISPLQALNQWIQEGNPEREPSR